MPTYSKDGTVCYPNLKPLKKGQGGPGRPKNGGQSIKECLNKILSQKYSLKTIRQMSGEKNNIIAQRLAAKLVYQALYTPDMADFEKIIDGTMAVSTSARYGVDTRSISHIEKKWKEGKVVACNITLRESSNREAINDIIAQCDGKPKQTIAGPDGGPVMSGVLVLPPEMPPE